MRGNEWLFQGSFCTAVPLPCRVLETKRECTELIMRLDLMVIHTAASSGRHAVQTNGHNMCVCFSYTTDGQRRLLLVLQRLSQSSIPELLQKQIFRVPLSVCSISAQNLTEMSLLSLGFAIKTTSILVIKNRPVFIIFKEMKKK